MANEPLIQRCLLPGRAIAERMGAKPDQRLLRQCRLRKACGDRMLRRKRPAITAGLFLVVSRSDRALDVIRQVMLCTPACRRIELAAGPMALSRTARVT
jgi:hypothetical protein